METRRLPPYDQDEAARHVARSGPEMNRLIEVVGPPDLVVGALSSPFEMLLESIVYQQLSGKAAATIYGRVEAMFGGHPPAPEALLAIEDVHLRNAGMSWAKVAAARDLASQTLDGTLPSLGELAAMPDDEIIASLTRVRGIGPWTVQMLLIFRLGRPDVLPAADLGVRKGLQITHSLAELPAPQEVIERGEVWRPYRSMASWYLWRAVDGVLPG